MSFVQLSWMDHKNIIANKPATEKEIKYDDYNNNENTPDTKARSLSYLEKILSMTTDVNKIEEDLKRTAIDSGKDESENENGVNGDDENAGEIDEEVVNHSDLINAKFSWQISKDYGQFELAHFDRPTPPDEFTEMLNSVLEENILRHQDNNNMKLQASNNKKNISKRGKPSPRTPSSIRSASPTLPTKPRTRTIGRAEDKTSYNFLKDIVHQDQNKNVVSQSNHVKSSALYTDWLISTNQNHYRPDSQMSRSTQQDHGGIAAKKTNVHKKRKQQRKTKYTDGDVEKVVKKVFTDFFTDDKVYDAEYLKQHIILLTDTIKQQVKYLYGARHRLICTVNIFESKHQTVRMASQCCWDDTKDNFIEYKFEGNGFTAVCVVYAIYKE